MSHPDGLPDLFVDRSLGRIKVPTLLRASGLRVTTLAEHYGVPADEEVRDVEWLELRATACSHRAKSDYIATGGSRARGAGSGPGGPRDRRF